MKPEISKFLRIKTLHAALAERGYVAQVMADNGVFVFSRPISDKLVESLIFSKNINADCLGNCNVHVESKTVRAVSMLIGVDQPDIKIEEHRPEITSVLVVNALWLRWNLQPERAFLYKDDYNFDQPGGVDRLIEDVDTVVADFVRSVSSERLLADMLCNLNGYPQKISWGGKPVSTNPYIYSAILYASVNERMLALNALDKGFSEYRPLAEPENWREIRFRKYEKEMERVKEWIYMH